MPAQIPATGTTRWDYCQLWSVMMSAKADNKKNHKTARLADEALWNPPSARPEVTYRAVPADGSLTDTGPLPMWRMMFELAHDPSIRVGLDVRGEVTLGRGQDGPCFVALGPFEADLLGVSRTHAMLRPTDDKLYIIDLGSTNGTWLNGHSIGVNTPYSLTNGDLLTLGRLELTVRIVKPPTGHTKSLRRKPEGLEALIPVARAITAQLDMGEVLRQSLDVAKSLVPGDEFSVWLVDERTGELFLEAELGIEDELIRRMRLPVVDSLPGQVIETGEPLRRSGGGDGGGVQVNAGYRVEAAVYLPLTLGGVTFGVLAAAHHKPGKTFSQAEQNTMMAIADLAAIAVQNARLYQATERSLARHTRIVTALNYALSYEFKNLLNTTIGYAGLLQSYEIEPDAVEITQNIVDAGNQMAAMSDQLIDITLVSEALGIRQDEPYDLVEVVNRAVDESRSAATSKSLELDFKLMGDPYNIRGDSSRMYNSVYLLIDNAIRYSEEGGEISVALIFGPNEIIIRVNDSGPSIPEDHLSQVFHAYSRGNGRTDGQARIELGLATIWAAVEAHRGTVAAQNAEDSGVAFIVTLPATLRVG
jgi:signal transduction histidine kinase